MELSTHENEKIIEIYLTRAERQDPKLRAGLQEIYTQFRGTKYTVAVFESGEQELYRNTLDLLAWNKRRMAEKDGIRFGG